MLKIVGELYLVGQSNTNIYLKVKRNFFKIPMLMIIQYRWRRVTRVQVKSCHFYSILFNWVFNFVESCNIHNVLLLFSLKHFKIGIFKGDK